MSNASNLSTLANVLDDGSDGQFLKSTGSGGVAFDTVAAGAVVYATADLLPLSGNSAGDMAYVTATNRFYINNGSGWYSVSLVNTNPNITSVQDAGSNTTPFTLATDGTATVITVTAADPEDIPLTYGYSVTSGSLNGSTVTQGTGSNTNVFTVTPHASQDATFTITFTASDGINQATSANAFSLSFVTIVTDSNHTTLLATATGTSDNNNITDSSSNSHSITVNGDAHAGTFSPYRSGGYSTLIPNGDANNLVIADDASFDIYDGDFTVEAWLYPTSFNASQNHWVSKGGNTTREWSFTLNSTEITAYWTTGGTSSTDSTVTVSATNSINEWMHICVKKSGSTLTIYKNGVSLGTGTFTSIYNGSGTVKVGRLMDFTGISHSFNGYISDLRIVKGTAITPPSGGPTERLEAVTNTSLLTCHLPYISDGSTNSHSITVNGNVSTKTLAPYDYEEYSAADNGGSVYFDGTGDYLEIPHSTNVGAFGTNDFTVQFWYYTDAANSQDYLIDFRQYGGNGDYLSISKNGSNKIVVAEGGSNRITGTKDISVGQWFFITVHRDNGSLKLFVNGEQDGSTYSDSTNYVAGSSGNFIIGKNNGSASYLMEGYLSDIRVTHGSALGGTTVPTAPLSSSGAVLHIKGTDASIIDKSQGSNLKLFGNTTGSTTQAKFSNTKSMYFGGETSGDYIQVTSTDEQLNLGKDPFTIEAWIFPDGAIGNNTLLSGGQTSTNRFDITGLQSTGLRFYVNSTVSCDEDFTEPSANVWSHIAFVRNGTSLSFYINGTLDRTATISADLSLDMLSYYLIIGERGHLQNLAISDCWDGYIQDLRITKGLARYTANFTPPTAPLEG